MSKITYALLFQSLGIVGGRPRQSYYFVGMQVRLVVGVNLQLSTMMNDDCRAIECCLWIHISFALPYHLLHHSMIGNNIVLLSFLLTLKSQNNNRVFQYESRVGSVCNADRRYRSIDGIRIPTRNNYNDDDDDHDSLLKLKISLYSIVIAC